MIKAVAKINYSVFSIISFSQSQLILVMMSWSKN